jgi:hypothetical protein
MPESDAPKEEEQPEMVTLHEAAQMAGLANAQGIHYYLSKLQIKTQKFEMNKNGYITLAQAEEIARIRKTPWKRGQGKKPG